MYSFLMEEFGFTPEETWHVIAVMNGLVAELRYRAGAVTLANEVRGSANDGMNSIFNGARWNPGITRAAADKIAKLEDWKANAVWFYVYGFWDGIAAKQQ